MQNQENRRISFRLNDTMGLQVIPLDPKALDEVLLDFDNYRIQSCLASHFHVQRELRQASLQLIRKRDPDIARYFTLLEDQMQVLAERMSGDDGSSKPDQSEISVNISSTGIRYHTEDAFSLGQAVELKMLLSTSGAQIYALGTVVRIENGVGSLVGLTEYSVNFSHIHSDDSEAFIRHMVKLQRLQLQARRTGDS